MSPKFWGLIDASIDFASHSVFLNTCRSFVQTGVYKIPLVIFSKGIWVIFFVSNFPSKFTLIQAINKYTNLKKAN